MANRYKGAIALIKSQTNYTDDDAVKKLEQWDGNYMNVIKEYLNPNFQQKEKKEKKSINETMMGEIRNFMDTTQKQYEKRKEFADLKKKKAQEIYELFLENKKNNPDCTYNPPGELSCKDDCKNPMCPGEKMENGEYNKISNIEEVD